jgi:hypothetical protein
MDAESALLLVSEGRELTQVVNTVRFDVTKFLID